MVGNIDFEHFADGDIEFNSLTTEEISALCDELFTHPPVVFTPKKGEYNEIHKAIALKI